MKKLILASALISSVCFGFNRESGGMLGPSAIYLDFQSYGAGVDSQSLSLYESVIADAKSKGLLKEETQEGYGIEGEVRTCVEFLYLDDHLRFLDVLIPSLLQDVQNQDGRKRTRMYVGAHCHHFEEAQEDDYTSPNRELEGGPRDGRL